MKKKLAFEVPEFLRKKLREFYKEFHGCGDKDIPADIKVAVADWSHCIFDGKFVFPKNTSGSDDYHTYREIFTHNAEIVFGAGIPSFIAEVAIYAKLNPAEPAFFVIYASTGYTGKDYEFTLVVW